MSEKLDFTWWDFIFITGINILAVTLGMATAKRFVLPSILAVFALAVAWLLYLNLIQNKKIMKKS